MKHKILIFSIAICYLSGFSQNQETFKDLRDGKVYKTVIIGTQTIFAENLAYKPATGNFWSYENDAANLEKFGYLYDWATAKTIAPAGWHLPTKEEWETFILNAGYDKNEVFNNIGPDGSSGFNLLLGGFRGTSKTFRSIHASTDFWCSDTDAEANPWSFNCDTDFASVNINVSDAACGFYVRLFKD